MTGLTMDFERAPFRLQIKREPFSFAVQRGDTVLLESTPHVEAVIDLRVTGDLITLAFPSATLTITFTAKAAGFHWQSSRGAQQSGIRNFGYWFGQGELVHQRWPLDRVMQPPGELLTYDNGHTGLLCIQTPAWLSSNGVAILAHSPIGFALNQPPADYPRFEWDLGAKQGPFDQRPCADPGGAGDGRLTLSGHDLHFEILLAEDLPSAYRALIARVGRPASTPPAGLFSRPTWTTWARYKTAIDQAAVVRFADEIIQHRYPYHVMEIDDKWQVHYGDLSFDPRRFPDPKAMIDQLHDRGFKVTAWVIPFLDPQSAAFGAGAANGYLVQTQTGEPYLVKWWQGRGGLLDATNPDALDWFLSRLRQLQAETGLDGFKFDAGEAIFVPDDAVWLGRTRGFAPTRNDYTHHYVEFVAKSYALTEVRSGWFNQSAPIFFRQWDKTSNWTEANGLRSVISGLLSLSLTGYPFVLPDMIGGNAYQELPDAELMIRWTQLNALLPAMQFSLAPWDFGPECVEVCRRYSELHLEFAPAIVQLAEEAARTGEPIVRPLFWLAPHDERAWLCDDEFLLGNDMLIAPVVQPGERARDIYLPPGRWRDHWTDRAYDGPLTLTDYPAPLDHLPIFHRQSM